MEVKLHVFLRRDFFDVSDARGGSDKSKPVSGSGSSGSVFAAGSAGSGSKTVRFPVHGSVPKLPAKVVVRLASWY